MRFARDDMRDHIVSHKNDHGASYRRYGVLPWRSRLKINFCEIFDAVRFSTFATLSATSGRSETAAWVRSKVKTVLKLWSSARYRATRRAGWRRNCHAYAAIGVRGISWKFGGPTLQGEVFQFGDNFINDDITDLRQLKAGDPPRSS
jgi:hypothetical protein